MRCISFVLNLAITIYRRLIIREHVFPQILHVIIPGTHFFVINNPPRLAKLNSFIVYLKNIYKLAPDRWICLDVNLLVIFCSKIELIEKNKQDIVTL